MEISSFQPLVILKKIPKDIADLFKIQTWKELFKGKNSILNFGERYPLLNRHYESNIRNLFIIGNLSGEADIKAALNQGYKTAHTLAKKINKQKVGKKSRSVLIIGGGPAGVAAALELENLGVDYLLLEKQSLFTTIQKFNKELPLYYAKTGLRQVLSPLGFQDSTTTETIQQWHEYLKDHSIRVKEGVQVKDIVKKQDRFIVSTIQEEVYESDYVILAMGKLVLLDRLQVAEEKGCVTKDNVEMTKMPEDLLCRTPLRYERTFTWRTWLWCISWISLIAVFYTLKKVHPQMGTIHLGSIYPWMYTGIVLVFGVKAILRYKDKLQTKKFLSLMFFQTTFFCVIPEIILNDWKAYSILYVWPLGLSPMTVQSLFQNPTTFYFWWTLTLTLIVLPFFVILAGKQYCSWICGCGGLAETLGDSWRHYRPGGKVNSKRERQIFYVTAFAAIATLWAMFRIPGENFIKTIYGWTVDFALIAVIPVALYPFMGGKVWCRYWCPTAGVMHLISAWFTKKGKSRYLITSRKERCIACNLCTRFCEVGIDVRSFALKGETITNLNSSCIGCGICVSVCPTDVLRMGSFTMPKMTAPISISK